MRQWVRGLLLMGLMAVGGAASAQTMSSWNGAAEITRGDYAAAERAIQAQQRLFPRDVDLMLNLAIVYRRTGRVSDARALYLKVLAGPDEPLDMIGDRPRSAHTIAGAALRQMTGQQLTAR